MSGTMPHWFPAAFVMFLWLMIYRWRLWMDRRIKIDFDWADQIRRQHEELARLERNSLRLALESLEQGIPPVGPRVLHLQDGDTTTITSWGASPWWEEYLRDEDRQWLRDFGPDRFAEPVKTEPPGRYPAMELSRFRYDEGEK